MQDNNVLGDERVGKWTPGEWRVFGDPEDMPGIDTTLPDGMGFSIVGYAEPDDDSDYGIRGRDMSEAWANAHLFVASPKLYTELARLVAALEPLEHTGGWPLDSAGVATLNGARAALALAEGGEG